MNIFFVHEGICLPAVPYGWTNRPCKNSFECWGNNLQCFKLTETEKYGRCIPYACQKDIDCASWMTCQSGICSYQMCSHKKPCKPGLTCGGEGFCFLTTCFSTYHCPPNYECIGGKCAITRKMCNYITQCDDPSSQLCDRGKCYERNCKSDDDCPFSSQCNKGFCTNPCDNCKVI